jgi:hypothetical protein
MSPNGSKPIDNHLWSSLLVSSVRLENARGTPFPLSVMHFNRYCCCEGSPSAYRIEIAASDCGAAHVVKSYRSWFVMRDIELSNGDHLAAGSTASVNVPAQACTRSSYPCCSYFSINRRPLDQLLRLAARRCRPTCAFQTRVLILQKVTAPR